MVSLSIAIPVAVSCAALFVAMAVIGTVVWIRLRKERISLAAMNASQRRYALGTQHLYDTITELSHEEGTALRRYGQLPYGCPTEWGLLSSRDTLPTPAAPSESKSGLIERAQSFRKSLSFSRPKSAPPNRLQKRNILSSCGPVTDSPKHLAPPGFPYSTEGVQVSAVEGALELPTQVTPRQTPEREYDRNGLDLNMRPISSASLGVASRRHSHFPVFEHRPESKPPPARVRGWSITAQSPGEVPSQPAPLPPVAYPPNRFTLSKDNSLMRLSSLSLDTADSSILGDGMGASATDGELASPALPPCPTFAPYSADDVGRGYSGCNPAACSSSLLLPSTAFPTNSTLPGSFQHGPPRRSQTTRSPSFAAEHASPPPRRSESLYTNPIRRSSWFGTRSRTSWEESSLLPHFSQMQHNLPNANTPFGCGHTPINNPNPPSRQGNLVREPPQQTAELLQRAPLYSAMKGSKEIRKGHRRQNCVRISVHPPVMFQCSGFPPTFEEVEELEGADKHRSQACVFDLSTSNLPSPAADISPVSMKSPSSAREAIVFRDPHYSPMTPTKKRKHNRPEEDVFCCGKKESLPKIFTSFTSGDGSLSTTPSPEKTAPILLQSSNTSPVTHENQGMGSPQRQSIVKGPRCQPGKTPSSFRSPAPLGESLASTPTESPSRQPRPSDSNNSNNDHYRGNSAPGQETSGAQHAHRPGPGQAMSLGHKKAPSANSGSCVTIWEDQKDERSSIKKSPGVHGAIIELASLSPRGTERRKSTTRTKKSPWKASKATNQTPGQSFATPTRPRVGLGIDTTPGSLYDREGFLMEYPGRYT